MQQIAFKDSKSHSTIRLIQILSGCSTRCMGILLAKDLKHLLRPLANVVFFPVGRWRYNISLTANQMLFLVSRIQEAHRFHPGIGHISEEHVFRQVKYVISSVHIMINPKKKFCQPDGCSLRRTKIISYAQTPVPDRTK